MLLLHLPRPLQPQHTYGHFPPHVLPVRIGAEFDDHPARASSTSLSLVIGRCPYLVSLSLSSWLSLAICSSITLIPLIISLTCLSIFSGNCPVYVQASIAPHLYSVSGLRTWECFCADTLILSPPQLLTKS